MPHPLFELLGDPKPFLDRVFSYLEQDKVDVSDLFMDHICYRVETMARYKALKQSLLALGVCLTDKEVGGRPIATFELSEAFSYRRRSCRLLELPAPKSGRFYAEGYEHIEFVIPDLQAFADQYAHLPLGQKGLAKAINPDLKLTYEAGSVKFHPYPLDYVIRVLEQ
ncbi:MAG: VOC family protein [Bacteroidota bacterium]